MKMIREINEMENRVNETKSWSFEKIRLIGICLTTLIKKNKKLPN